MKIKTVIFDLDDTLLDTSGLLVPIAMTPEFLMRIQKPLPLMKGAEANLQFLSQKYQLLLLTQGDPQVQQAKIRSLGIARFFDQVLIADFAKNQSKEQYFFQLISSSSDAAESFFSIGNRRSTDIRGAKKHGAQTCLFRYGEHQDEPIENSWDRPDFEISCHEELIKICHL